MRQLYKSHRTMGYEVARTHADDGAELVILETATHKQEVARAHTLMPVSPEETAFTIRVALAEIVEQARFLGLDPETVVALLTEELMKEA